MDIMFPLQEVLKEFDMEDVAYADIKVSGTHEVKLRVALMRWKLKATPDSMGGAN